MSNVYPIGGKGGLPSDLMTSAVEGIRRLKVDQESTAYLLGRQFRVSYPLVIPDETPVTLRVTSPVDFELVSQEVEAHEKGFVFEAFRSLQGSETGVYDSIVPIYRNNLQSSVVAYTRTITIETGGGFTPNVDELPVETINVLTASSNAQRTTSFAGANGKRGLPAGVYYLRMSKIGSTGDALGVYSLIFNENN